jgi:hypothetical protein
MGGGDPNPQPGKAARTNTDENGVCAAPAQQGVKQRHQLLGMAPRHHLIDTGEQAPVGVEQGGGARRSGSIKGKQHPGNRAMKAQEGQGKASPGR